MDKLFWNQRPLFWLTKKAQQFDAMNAHPQRPF